MHSPSACLKNRLSWPTQSPSTTFNWQPASFSSSAWATGLQSDSCPPGRIFSSSRSPISSFGMPPFLQAADATSRPWLSRMRLSVAASSTKLMQVAMPFLV
ncbi:MAG: hypothetical protein VW405_06200 [Rhodospirillaceae bacterium]